MKNTHKYVLVGGIILFIFIVLFPYKETFSSFKKTFVTNSKGERLSKVQASNNCKNAMNTSGSAQDECQMGKSIAGLKYCTYYRSYAPEQGKKVCLLLGIPDKYSWRDDKGTEYLYQSSA